MNRHLLLVSCLICALVLACSGKNGESLGPTATASLEAAATAAPQPVETAGLPSSVELQRVFPDLSFEFMTGAYKAPDGAWWVTEKAGRVMRIEPTTGAAAALLDITSKVNSQGSEEGLLGLAFAPGYETSKAFFVYYSAANPRRSVVSRFIANSAQGTFSGVGTESIRLEIAEPFANHNGGQLAFGTDGYLYIGIGDGGSARDPQGNGQNLGTLLASILRIDVSAEQGYKVPSDNPFVGEKGARGEIWAYGLRNPWRFSFDSATGDLWVADVGQDTREEIDMVTRGGNYGWNVMEGFDCLGGGSGCNKDDFLLPVIDYGHEDGDCSITGGFVYRGNAIPELRGAYVYSDYCSGKIWALRYNGNAVTERAEIADSGFNVSSFAQDEDGELYVLQYAGDGGIYKLVP